MQKDKQAQYSAKERKAYYMGVGAGIGFGKAGYIQRFARTLSPAEKKSFYNGLDSFMSKNKER